MYIITVYRSLLGKFFTVRIIYNLLGPSCWWHPIWTHHFFFFAEKSWASDVHPYAGSLFVARSWVLLVSLLASLLATFQWPVSIWFCSMNGPCSSYLETIKKSSSGSLLIPLPPTQTSVSQMSNPDVNVPFSQKPHQGDHKDSLLWQSCGVSLTAHDQRWVD